MPRTGCAYCGQVAPCRIGKPAAVAVRIAKIGSLTDGTEGVCVSALLPQFHGAPARCETIRDQRPVKDRPFQTPDCLLGTRAQSRPDRRLQWHSRQVVSRRWEHCVYGNTQLPTSSATWYPFPGYGRKTWPGVDAGGSKNKTEISLLDQREKNGTHLPCRQSPQCRTARPAPHTGERERLATSRRDGSRLSEETCYFGAAKARCWHSI